MEALWPLALDALRLTQQYLFTRKSQEGPASEMDGLRFIVDHARLGICIKRYQLFLVEHWRDSFRPYEPWMREAYGIGPDDLIRGFEAIEEYQKRGAIERYGEFMSATETLTERLRAKGYAGEVSFFDESGKKAAHYLKDIDMYFAEKYAGRAPARPEQKLPPRMMAGITREVAPNKTKETQSRWRKKG